MLILVTQRLLASLPVGNIAWIINDILRAASFTALSFFAVSLISYSNLRLKCLMAAVAGWASADLLQCLIWYSTGWGGYWIATAMEATGFIVMAAIYWRRSYDQPSAIPEPGHIYCLRNRPNTVQDFLIALCGFFGPWGSYAIYCNGHIYQFRNGYLIKTRATNNLHLRYHCSIGAALKSSDVNILDNMVGQKWALAGNNCITSLGKFWHARR